MANTVQNNSLCLVFNKGPFASDSAKELLDMALAFATFDAQVTLVFLDQGLFQLLQNNDAKRIGLRDFTRLYPGLALYDINKLLVSKASLERFAITSEQLFDNVQVVDESVISKELENAQWVFSL